MSEPQDLRKHHALRQHIDELLAAGAAIIARDPVTLIVDGQTLRVRHGMLIGYSGVLDLVEPARDHEWPEALRQMAIDLCLKQLDSAIEAFQTGQQLLQVKPSANDSQH
ncbi:hypothetical protein [Stutzerimonas chloritidismutans]|uniref:hypothetical protein n=1 Tax=Stutzerimonas chloritidismutans TaxID=203192 RepID=UPI003F13E61D